MEGRVRLYEVIIRSIVEVREDVWANDEDEAADIALNNYTLKGGVIIGEDTYDVREVTDYREPVTI